MAEPPQAILTRPLILKDIDSMEPILNSLSSQYCLTQHEVLKSFTVRDWVNSFVTSDKWKEFSKCDWIKLEDGRWKLRCVSDKKDKESDEYFVFLNIFKPITIDDNGSKLALATIDYFGIPGMNLINFVDQKEYKKKVSETLNIKIKKGLMKRDVDCLSKKATDYVSIRQKEYYKKNGNFATSLGELIGKDRVLTFSNVGKLATTSYSEGQKYYIVAFATKGKKIFQLHGPDVSISNDKDQVLQSLTHRNINDSGVFVKKCISLGARVNRKTKKGWTPLLTASNNGLKDVVKELIANGADLDAKLETGYAPIHLAAMNNHKSCIAELVLHGADVNARGQADITPLMAAAFSGHPDSCRLLLTKGADIRAVNSVGNTALILASIGGSADVTKVLIENGADIHAKNKWGETALIKAAYKGKTRVIEELLKLGADPGMKNNDGMTALAAAHKNGHTETATLLERSVIPKDWHAICTQGVVEYLLSQGIKKMTIESTCRVVFNDVTKRNVDKFKAFRSRFSPLSVFNKNITDEVIEKAISKMTKREKEACTPPQAVSK